MTDTVVVTGGSGFLGSALIDLLLDAGYDVCNIDLVSSRRAADLAGEHIVDLTDRDATLQIEFTPGANVAHLAGRQYSGQVKRAVRSRFFQEGNVEGTRNALDMAQRNQAQSFSFVSTDMVYGTPQRSPVDTGHPRNPFGPYGASKVAAEDMILSETRPFRSIVYRPRLIVGPGRFGLMAKLFKAIRKGLPVPIIGSGENVYQMVSVFDCASAIVKGIENPAAEGVFNLGSTESESSRPLIDNLIRTVGSRSRTVPIPSGIIKPVLRVLDRFDLSPLVPEQFEIADQQYVLDVSQTRDVLGWDPSRSDAEMMLAAYRRYCDVHG
ncbi:NAD-dependent epimerase/dehydratase family protein [Qipengyuania zhejiangensis]|uniref:NAD-dependent epimerase/dehydratase family protein n=1 Tax=Qipengyuania zhejiangensis TaxID=3077782 RepID=UPI002D793F0E|nr:NAD(P)-dependent oxidoreductase [Qipengyuania sp. Z2]